MSVLTFVVYLSCFQRLRRLGPETRKEAAMHAATMVVSARALKRWSHP
jgi:hypothetical protein